MRNSENGTVRRSSGKTVSAKETDSLSQRRTNNANTGRSSQTGQVSSETVTRNSTQFDSFRAARDGFDSVAGGSDNIGLQGGQAIVDTADDVRTAVKAVEGIRQRSASQGTVEQGASEQSGGSNGVDYGTGSTDYGAGRTDYGAGRTDYGTSRTDYGTSRTDYGSAATQRRTVGESSNARSGTNQRYTAGESATEFSGGTVQRYAVGESGAEVGGGAIRRYAAADAPDTSDANSTGAIQRYQRTAQAVRHAEGEAWQSPEQQTAEQPSQTIRRRVVGDISATDAGNGTAEVEDGSISAADASGKAQYSAYRRAAEYARRTEGETQPSVTPETSAEQPTIVRTTSEQKTQSIRRHTVGDVAKGKPSDTDEVPQSVQRAASRAVSRSSGIGKTDSGAESLSATGGASVKDFAIGAAVAVAYQSLASDSKSESDSDDLGAQALDTANDGAKGAVRRYIDKRADGSVGRHYQKPRATTPTREAKTAAIGKDAKAAATNDSQFYQQQKIKQKYAAARKNGWRIGKAVTGGTGSAGTGAAAKKVTESVVSSVSSTPLLRIVLIGLLIFALIVVLVSSCTAGGGLMGATIYSSYTAEPEDIVEVEEYYSSLEDSLWDSVEAQVTAAENSGKYYRVDLTTNGGVGHDPWKLASLLTVLFEDYKLDSEVKSFLSQMLDVQYEVSSTVVTETIVTGTERYYFVSSNVNVLSSAGGSVVGSLAEGTEVTVLGSKTVNGVMWYRIGASRWVAARYVKSDVRDITEDVDVLQINFVNNGLDYVTQNMPSGYGSGSFDTARYNLLLEDYGNRYADLIEYDAFKTYHSSGVSSISIPSNAEEIWNYLMDLIGNEYGVAGLMGNLYCESGLKTNNLQDTYNQSLGYDDLGYTIAVDTGTYGYDSFIHDSAGYGLAQWTDSTRKTKLYKFWRNSGAASISDLQMQLDYLAEELQTNYSKVLDTLKSATSVRQASDAVLTRYEIPAGYDLESKQASRASYGECFYNYYVSGIISSGELTDAQRAVVYVALSMESYVTPQNGYCLGYVCGVVKAATGIQGGGHCAAEAKIAYANSAINYDLSVMPVGAAVFTTQTSSTAESDGHKLGHVGIYVGNGQIMDCSSGTGGCLLSNCGSHPLIHLRTVEHWQSLYSDLSWGWIGNCDLSSEEYGDYVASGISIG